MHRTSTTSPSAQELNSLPFAAQATRSESGELEAFQRYVTYWDRHLLSASALNLPADKPRPTNPTSHLAWKSASLPGDLRDSLIHFSLIEQVPLSVVLLGAFHALLLRYTSQEEIVMGCSIPSSASGNAHDEFLLRADLSGDPSFRNLLKRINSEVLESLAHGSFSLRRLVEHLTSSAQTLISQISFSYRVLDQEAKRNPPRPLIPQTLVDLHFDVEEGEQGILLSVLYNTDLFEAESIDRTLRNLQTLLLGVAENPDQELSKLPILTAEEAHQVLVQWNQTACDYPHKCLHELVEAQAERVADGPAVICGNLQLTYREFNSRANQLAHYLRSRGVGPDVRVGICLEPSIDFAVAVLAVLKSGGACVPLDPNYPVERLGYMLQDVQAQVLVTKSGILSDGIPYRLRGAFPCR